MSYTDPVQFTAANSYSPDDDDDVYTVSEFMNRVEEGSFIDYDGFGHPVRDGKSNPDIYIYPSTAAESIPADATHIVWYNR